MFPCTPPENVFDVFRDHEKVISAGNGLRKYLAKSVSYKHIS